MHCPICGAKLEGSLCPRCSCDISLCGELYPTLTPKAPDPRGLSSRRQELYNKKLSLQSALTELTARHKTLRTELKAGENARTELQQQLDEQASRLEQLQAELDAARTSLKEQVDALRKSETLLTQKDEALRKSEQKAAHQEKALENVRKQAEEHKSALAELSGTKQEVQSKYDALKKDYEAQKARADRLKQENDGLNKTVEDLRRNGVKPKPAEKPIGWGSMEAPAIRTISGLRVCVNLDGTCEIVGPAGKPSGVLQIPAVLEGSRVKSIRSNAFRGCGKLTELELPEGLENVGQEAFSGCTGLRKVTLPYSATLRSGAFRNCENLRRADYPDRKPEQKPGFIERDAFQGCHASLTFHALEKTEPIRFADRECYIASVMTVAS